MKRAATTFSIVIIFGLFFVLPMSHTVNAGSEEWCPKIYYNPSWGYVPPTPFSLYGGFQVHDTVVDGFAQDNINCPLTTPKNQPLSFVTGNGTFQVSSASFSLDTCFPIRSSNCNNNAISAITLSGIPVFTANDVVAEDAVIDKIDREKKMTIQVGSPGFMMDIVPATNCVKLGGNGPIKVVFLRGKSWNSSVNEFVGLANDVIGNGFRSIDPYKTYIDQFSFYVDLQKHDDSLNLLGLGKRDVAAKSILSQTQCNGDLYLFNGDLTYPAYAAFTLPFAFLEYSDAPTAIHESGHAFAKLFDEYIYPSGTTGELWLAGKIMNSSIKNCTSRPSWDFRDSVSNKIYGSVTTVGCSYLQSTEVAPKDRDIYYRPSVNSLMNDQRVEYRPNVISCGYIVSAIDGEPLDQKHAQAHWPAYDPSGPGGIGCDAMDTIRDGRPPVSPASTISPPPTSLRFQSLANVFDVAQEFFEKIFGKSVQ